MRFIIKLPALRGGSRNMAQATLVSVLFHVGTAGAVFLALGGEESVPIPLPVYTVSLVDLPADAAPAGPPAPKQSAPAPQKKTPAAPDVEPLEAPPKKKKPRPEKPKPKEPEPVQQSPSKRDAEPVRDPAPPETEPQPATSTEPAGSGLAASTEGAGDGVPTIDSDAFQFAYYRDILTNRLRTTWSKPLIPGGLQQPIRCTVRFVILRSGAITDVELVESSQYPPLDRSALRSVFDANPLPPLPEPYEGDRLAVNFFFELTPER